MDQQSTSHGIYLRGLRNPRKNFNSPFTAQDSKPAPPYYKSEVLPKTTKRKAMLPMLLSPRTQPAKCTGVLISP